MEDLPNSPPVSLASKKKGCSSALSFEKNE
jgi:hypothetical protein